MPEPSPDGIDVHAGAKQMDRARMSSMSRKTSLDEVYLSENLPPITQADALAGGETRMLQRMGIADLPQRLQVVQTRTYQSSKTAPAHKTKQL